MTSPTTGDRPGSERAPTGPGADGPAAGSGLGDPVALSSFAPRTGGLTIADRRRLVDQALVLFEDNYVHLPLKRSMHAIEPVQALRLLRHRLEHMTDETMPPELEFHSELLRIFTSVRDLHTNYLLPAPFADKVAFLPFDVEEYAADGRRRYAVTHLRGEPPAPHFEVGVEVTHWNGVPIDRAVRINAERFAGSNLEARRARGVQFLTRRPLRTALAPDEHWVVVGYLDSQGAQQEVRQDWLVATLASQPGAVDDGALTIAAASLGMDLELAIDQQLRKHLFAPQVVAAEAAGPRREPARHKAAPGEELTTTLPGFLRARSVVTTHGTFGHVRIFGFDVNDPDTFVQEFARLVGLLPDEGLIVDVRANGGGHIWASEGLLQLLTPRSVEPEPTQFVSTPLNLRICRRHRDNPVGLALGGWVRSLEQAVETGAVYSSGVSITPPDWANALGQRYHGPVVLVTDALCYSATDIFAAGFQDHRIGPVLGVHRNTGAGGANVWTHQLLSQVLTMPAPADADSPYLPLPGGAGMRVSIRRTLRVGEQGGTPVEDLGVVPDHEHAMTRDDVVHDNRDLLDEAGRLLAAQPVRRLRASLHGGGDGTVLRCDTLSLDRVDVVAGGRPLGSFDVTDGSHDLPLAAAVEEGVRVDGYDAGELAASLRVVP